MLQGRHNALKGNEPDYCTDWLMTGVLSELAVTA